MIKGCGLLKRSIKCIMILWFAGTLVSAYLNYAFFSSNFHQKRFCIFLSLVLLLVAQGLTLIIFRLRKSKSTLHQACTVFWIAMVGATIPMILSSAIANLSGFIYKICFAFLLAGFVLFSPWAGLLRIQDGIPLWLLFGIFIMNATVSLLMCRRTF